MIPLTHNEKRKKKEKTLIKYLTNYYHTITKIIKKTFTYIYIFREQGVRLAS